MKTIIWPAVEEGRAQNSSRTERNLAWLKTLPLREQEEKLTGSEKVLKGEAMKI